MLQAAVLHKKNNIEDNILSEYVAISWESPKNAALWL